MARKQRNELWAGLYVLVSLAVTVGVVIWLGQSRGHGGRTIYIRSPLSAGDTLVAVGSEVKQGPLRIGRVEAIEPGDDWQSFLYRVRMERDVDLRSDALVETFVPSMITTVANLNVLTSGSAATPADRQHPIDLKVAPNPLIRDAQQQLGFGDTQRTELQETIHNLKAISDSMAAISQSLRGEMDASGSASLLTGIKGAVNDVRGLAAAMKTQMDLLQRQLDPDNPAGAMAKVHGSLDAVHQATTQVAAMTATVRPDVERGVASAANVATRLEELTAGDVAGLLSSLHASGQEMLQIMRDMRAVSAGAKEIMTVNRQNIDEILANLTQLSVHLKAASQEIRRQPWKLLGKPSVADVRTENIQVAAQAFADAAAELDSATQRLSGLAQLAEQPIPADDPQIQQVRQKLRDSFGKFLQAEQALYQELAP